MPGCLVPSEHRTRSAPPVARVGSHELGRAALGQPGSRLVDVGHLCRDVQLVVLLGGGGGVELRPPLRQMHRKAVCVLDTNRRATADTSCSLRWCKQPAKLSHPEAGLTVLVSMMVAPASRYAV